MGLSYSDFLDVTPRELSQALEDHAEYHIASDKQIMLLMRYVGTVLRNKGVKEIHQIKDPRKFYQLWWEYDKSKTVKLPTDEDWKRLDKKYSRPARN